MAIDELIHSQGRGLFHDFELQNVTVDYRNKQIAMQIKSPNLPLTTYKLILSGTLHFQMGFLEPWGKGIYVVATSIEPKGSAQYMEMTLNSGDSVIAEFEYIELQSD